MAGNNKNIIDLRVKPQKGKPRGKPFPKGEANVTAYKPGADWKGNAGGRPKGSGAKKISEAYNGALSQDIGEEYKIKLGLDKDAPCSWADAIAIQTCRKAVDGDSSNVNFTAITELRETTEGKTPEKTELGGFGGTPLNAPTFSVNFVKPMHEDGETLDGKPAEQSE